MGRSACHGCNTNNFTVKKSVTLCGQTTAKL